MVRLYTYKYNMIWRPINPKNIVNDTDIEATVKNICERLNFSFVELKKAQDYFCITIMVPRLSAKPNAYYRIIELKKCLADLKY